MGCSISNFSCDSSSTCSTDNKTGGDGWVDCRRARLNQRVKILGKGGLIRIIDISGIFVRSARHQVSIHSLVRLKAVLTRV